MIEHLKEHRQGFNYGLTQITDHKSADEPTGIGVSVWRLRAGEEISVSFESEAAWLLMDGAVELDVNGTALKWQRTSLFDEHPSCIHGSVGVSLQVTATTDAEFTIYECANTAEFPLEVYEPSAGVDEPRGAGQVGGTCLRFVRTIFDDTNSVPEAELVLGEVITMPGKWSSYPPHHHPQPEIYHYRFSDPRGWGHGELDDDILKIRPNDSVRILDKKTHAQVAAPGYAMYYSWVIRHLPDSRYGIPHFVEEHAWTMDEDADYWQPKGSQS